MRTARLASILLLASGSVIGLPQYSQDNTDDSGDGSISGNFWWQQGNAFEGSSGTNVQEQLGNIFNQVVNAFNTSVAQVTSQVTSGSYNTPVQSEYCAVGQGCVPWQLCPNAIITQGANVVSGTPYPADAAFTGCGDVTGNVCCGIPTDVLDQQQQDTNAPNIYDTCSAGLDCVTIDKCNLYTGFIEPQVETYSGQAFVEYNRCTGSGAIENVCCQAKPSGQQNLGAGSYSTPAPLNAQCASNQDCVPYFQCANGVINTDGAGLLDLRVKPRATCSHPDYPDVPAICCNIPGAPEPIVSSTYAPTPAPISSSSYAPVSVVPATSSTCSGYKECVPSSLCDASGNIVTDGADLIDLRIVHKGCLIDGTAPGVCCTPPGAPTPSPIPQINICPKQSTCIEPSLCRGEALQDAVADSWNSYSTNGNIFTQCTIGSVYSGVCCINPAPQIDSCPGLSSCIEPSLCKGEALQDAVADTWNSYSPTGNIFTQCAFDGAYSRVCCINPAPQIDSCPGLSSCVAPSLCSGEALLDAVTDTWNSYSPTGNIFTECAVGGAYSGVCCINPAPQIDSCPGLSSCVAPSLCSGEALLDAVADTWNSYSPTGNIFTECAVGGAYSGVCCINPAPQIDSCPGLSSCVAPSLCSGEALLDAVADTWNSYSPTGNIFTECAVGGAYSGVCCINPAPQIDSCPGLSSCIEPSLCKGEALQDAVADSWTSYAPTGNIFTECTVGAAYTGGPGVCCINPAAPITAVEVCPDYNECVPQNLCDQNGNINTDGSGIIDVRRKQIACYTDLATYETGVCCKPPGPAQPVINVVEYCPGTSVCTPVHKCTGQALDNDANMVSYASGGIWSSCNLVGKSTAPGICCENPPPPLPVVDTCPGVSSCVPDLLCSGQVLNSNGDMIAYNPGGSWSQCPMGGGGVMGVCCIPPPPVYSTVAPIIAADQCGRRNQEEVLNTRIQSVIAKNEAQFGEFPWQAIIFFSNYTFKCGASLIGDRWLLTGGHCVNGFQPNDIQIRLGEWQVNSFDEPLPYTDVQVKSITVHPDFNPKNVKNNIAVVELAEPVEIQYHINSICLPAPGDTFWNQRCFVTGWGKDSFEGNYQHILKKIDLPMVDKSTCQALLRKTRLGKWFFLDSSFICAGGEENKDACKGDGGGPLACEDPKVPGRYVLAGMTSWGIGCGNKDVPGVYADVQGFSEWIQGVIGGTLVQQQQVVGPEIETGSNPYGK